MDISHRKVKKQIQFVDAQGKPLANKQVKIQQTKGEYKLGADGKEVAAKLTDNEKLTVIL